MSGPGSPAPAGWYPDPDGAPGMVRWWNGVSWSDVTTPAGPGVAVQPPPVAPPPAGHWPPAGPPSRGPSRETIGSTGPGPAGSSPRPRRIAWGVGLGVLGLVLVVVVALLVGRGDGDAAARSSGSAPTDSGSAFPPGTVRIVDLDSGIAYPFLGDGWYQWDQFTMRETTAITGQYFVTQDQTPNGIFIAQCTSGPLAPAFGSAGSLATTTQDVADSTRLHYYPAPNDREVLRDEDTTVDGAPAHLYEFQLSWDVEGFDATGERAALLLIDVGRAQPALLYISIPNTQAELYGVIDRIIAAVEVL